jgi:nicotinamide riboside transporter PnuC
MKIKNPFKDLNRFELGLWLTSAIVVIISFIFSPEKDVLTLVASLFGVTALIFIAKGRIIGQGLVIILPCFTE